jgi:hypothetical protein
MGYDPRSDDNMRKANPQKCRTRWLKFQSRPDREPKGEEGGDNACGSATERTPGSWHGPCGLKWQASAPEIAYEILCGVEW